MKTTTATMYETTKQQHLRADFNDPMADCRSARRTKSTASRWCSERRDQVIFCKRLHIRA